MTQSTVDNAMTVCTALNNDGINILNIDFTKTNPVITIRNNYQLKKIRSVALRKGKDEQGHFQVRSATIKKCLVQWITRGQK